MDKSLVQRLKELDAKGQLDKQKAIIADVANFSISSNLNSNSNNLNLDSDSDSIDIPKSVTFTSGNADNKSGDADYVVHNVPVMYPAPAPNIQWDLGNQTLTFPAPASGQELLGMLVEGKDLIKDRNEFIEVIMRLPSVGGDNLKAIEVYERLRKLAITSGLVDVETVGDKKE